MRDPHLTQIILNQSGVACVRRDRSGVVLVGVGGREEFEERSGHKGDNEGRQTQIGQNNILVGRFA